MVVLNDKAKEQVLISAANFALRVLEGERCTPQETAVLPAVLDLLFCEEISHAKRQWGI